MSTRNTSTKNIVFFSLLLGQFEKLSITFPSEYNYYPFPIFLLGAFVSRQPLEYRVFPGSKREVLHEPYNLLIYKCISRCSGGGVNCWRSCLDE